MGKSLALAKEVNLATLSSAPSAVEMIELGKEISIFYCLREERFFVNVSSCSRGLKCQ